MSCPRKSLVLRSVPVVGLSARRIQVALLLALAGLSACSSESESDPSVGLTTVISRSGALRVTLTSSPSEVPIRGTNQLEFFVEAVDSGLPLEGLELTMVPFMPAMGHGSATLPRTEVIGGGRYQFADVVLAMPGLWELGTTIAGAKSDYVVPRFDVQ